jgi:glycosyltransferase involved in cell wall biosynthesis
MSVFVSVVIPSYNQAHFLGRALQSLIDQTYQYWEAIIVDNHSDDESIKVASQFEDNRIRVFSIHNHGVIAASRNLGVSKAKGNWIAFLDSDDWWTKDKLQICVEVMNNNIDLIYHDLTIVREKKSIFERDKIRTRQLQKPVFTDLLTNNNAISNSSVVVRKELIDKVGGLLENKEMIGAEDYNAWLRIAKLTDNFLYIPKYLGFYQIHGSGISRKDMSECYGAAIADFENDLTEVQRNNINATLIYIRGKHLFMNKKYNSTLNELSRNLLMGSKSIRLKSICIMVLAFFLNLIPVDKA